VEYGGSVGMGLVPACYSDLCHMIWNCQGDSILFQNILLVHQDSELVQG